MTEAGVRTHFSMASDDNAILFLIPGPFIDVLVYVIVEAFAALARRTPLHDACYQTPVYSIFSKLLDLHLTKC